MSSSGPEIDETPRRRDVRNIAIIAHVDHGKTTLVDGFLRQAGSFRPGEVIADCAMDSNDLERERGITILAKFTAITWKGTRINIVDTPGHADFGGEVERVLKMVDSVLLLVDAFEGPMPQTRFVTRKALALGLRPILVVNKIDRAGCDPDAAVNDTFDLFCALGASEEQLDFPVVYASGREGYAVRDLKRRAQGSVADARPGRRRPRLPRWPTWTRPCPCTWPPSTMTTISATWPSAACFPAGSTRANAPCACIATAAAKNSAWPRSWATSRSSASSCRRPWRATSAPSPACSDLTVGETITEIARPVVLPLLEIEEPTVKMQFMSNNGPFAGQEGKFVTSRNIRERLFKEIKSNVALRVLETDSPDTFEVLGRGELHLSVLIETMRREGYELMVSQPQVIFKEGPNGEKLEPYEELVIDLDEAYNGPVIEELGRRGGRMQEMGPAGEGRTRLEYIIPSRGLIGYRSQFLTDTRGTGILNHNFIHYGPYAGTFKGRTNGVLIAQDPGQTNTYALFYLQERGALLLPPGIPVYGGQVVGLHARGNDIIVNPSKAKKLTNIRTTAADEKLFLTPPLNLTLEAALELINEDELVEVTPKSIRLRKRILDHNERKRVEKLRDQGLEG